MQPCSHGAKSWAKRKRGRTKHYWNTLSSPFSVHWRQFKHVHILLRYVTYVGTVAWHRKTRNWSLICPNTRTDVPKAIRHHQCFDHRPSSYIFQLWFSCMKKNVYFWLLAYHCLQVCAGFSEAGELHLCTWSSRAKSRNSTPQNSEDRVPAGPSANRISY